MATEKRLIDANELMEAIKFEHDCIMQDPEVSNNMKWCEAVCNHRVTEAIERTPTVDAVEVVHGRWIGVDTSYWRWYHDGARAVERITYRCSECARKSIIKTNYCPNCGAKMDGDGDG